MTPDHAAQQLPDNPEPAVASETAHPALPDWVEVERLVRETPRSLREIARRADVPHRMLCARSARLGWRPSSAPSSSSRIRTRRTLIRRFYKAIGTKLKQMETRMAKDIETGEGSSTSADHERDARTIGGLINQLGKLSEYESENAVNCREHC